MATFGQVKTMEQAGFHEQMAYQMVVLHTGVVWVVIQQADILSQQQIHQQMLVIHKFLQAVTTAPTGPPDKLIKNIKSKNLQSFDFII